MKGTEGKPWGGSGVPGAHVYIWEFVRLSPGGVGRWAVEGQCVCPLSFPRVPYLAVARTFEKIEEVSAR